MYCIAAYEGQSGSKDRGDPEVSVNILSFLHFLMIYFRRLLTFLWPIYPLMSLNNLLGPFLLVTVLLAP
jgi:hypothetical protein